MRIFLHYIFAMGVLLLYGGQVCPFIDSINIISWAVTLFFVFSTAFIIRRLFLPHLIERVSLDGQVRWQFLFDLFLFVIAGVFIGLFNHFYLGFPLGSGIKITLGCLILGFFAASDTALERERINHETFKRSEGKLLYVGKSLTLAGRFTITASLTIFFMAAVIFLIVSRDLLIWIEGIGPDGLASARMAVVKELAFVGSIFLLQMINLISSFSKNLKLFFSNENETLIGVAGGDLDRQAVGKQGG